MKHPDFEDVKSQQPIRHRRDSIAANLESERIRLRQSHAYHLVKEGQEDGITIQDFYQFARINEYFGEKARQRRYAIVGNAAAGDEVLSKVWSMLKVRFQRRCSQMSTPKPIEVTSHVARDFLQNSAYFNTMPKIIWEYVSNSLDNAREGIPAVVAVEITSNYARISDNGLVLQPHLPRRAIRR